MSDFDTTNILEQALLITGGDRQNNYGSPKENWERTVAIFNAMTGRDLMPAEAVKFAIAMKLARLHQTPDHMDSIVDLAGYAWVYSEVAR